VNDAELEFAQTYLKNLTNTRRLIEATRNNRNAPIDATRPLEGSLRALQEQNVHKILEILLRDAVDREIADLPNAETRAVLNEL
jgi:hypothetical protein